MSPRFRKLFSLCSMIVPILAVFLAVRFERLSLERAISFRFFRKILAIYTCTPIELLQTVSYYSNFWPMTHSPRFQNTFQGCCGRLALVERARMQRSGMSTWVAKFLVQRHSFLGNFRSVRLRFSEHRPVKYFLQQESFSVRFSFGQFSQFFSSFLGLGSGALTENLLFLCLCDFLGALGMMSSSYFLVNQSSAGSSSLPTDSISSTSFILFHKLSSSSSSLSLHSRSRQSKMRWVRCLWLSPAKVFRMVSPISRQSLGWQGVILKSPSFWYPQKELSTVQTQGILSVSKRTFLAVRLLPPLNLLDLQSNLWSLRQTIMGNTLMRLVRWVAWLAQKKVPSFLECECRSSTISFLSFSIIFLRVQMMGWQYLCGSFHFLFESQPMSSARVLPCTTPSMLTIGTILNTKWDSRYSASSVLDSRKSTIPSSMKLEVVQPECCLAMIQMDFLWGFSSGDEIWKRFTSFPPKVYPRLFSFILEDSNSLLSLCVRKLVRLLKVQGSAQLKQTMSPSYTNRYSKERQQQGSLLDYFLNSLLSLYATLVPSLTHPTFLFSYLTIEKTEGFMPYSNSECFLERLTILNLRLAPLGTLRTLKKNHWLLPLVLMSFCRTRSYSLCSRWYTLNRLPDQKLELNSMWLRRFRVLRSVLKRSVMRGVMFLRTWQLVWPRDLASCLGRWARFSRQVAKQLPWLAYFSQMTALQAQKSLRVESSLWSASAALRCRHFSTSFLSFSCVKSDSSMRAMLFLSKWYSWWLMHSGNLATAPGQYCLGWQGRNYILCMRGLGLGIRFLTQMRSSCDESRGQGKSSSEENSSQRGRKLIKYNNSTIKFYYQVRNNAAEREGIKRPVQLLRI